MCNILCHAILFSMVNMHLDLMFICFLIMVGTLRNLFSCWWLNNLNSAREVNPDWSCQSFSFTPDKLFWVQICVAITHVLPFVLLIQDSQLIYIYLKSSSGFWFSPPFPCIGFGKLLLPLHPMCCELLLSELLLFF